MFLAIQDFSSHTLPANTQVIYSERRTFYDLPAPQQHYADFHCLVNLVTI